MGLGPMRVSTMGPLGVGKRDDGLRMVGRVTRWLAAGAVALTAVVTFVAAGAATGSGSRAARPSVATPAAPLITSETLPAPAPSADPGPSRDTTPSTEPAPEPLPVPTRRSAPLPNTSSRGS